MLPKGIPCSIPCCHTPRGTRDCIPLPHCTASNINYYKEQIGDAITSLTEQQEYTVYYESKIGKWHIDYGYNTRPMIEKCETAEEKTACLRKHRALLDCITKARKLFPHNITNPPLVAFTDEEEQDDRLRQPRPRINWEHAIFNFDKDYFVASKIYVSIFYDVTKKDFFLNVFKMSGMNHVKHDVIRHIEERLSTIEQQINGV